MQRGKEISVLVLILALSVTVLTIVRAWTGPTATPPGGDGVITASSGNVGVGTTTPQSIFHIAGAVPRILLFDSDAAISSSNPAWSIRGLNSPGNFVIQSTTNYSAYSDRLTITSTGDVTIAQDLTVSGGDLTVTKINVSTIDPIYTIGGKRYATYVASMIGQKEEVTGVFAIDGTKVINFRDLAEGSDLWLFAKATDLERNFDKMVVILTPSFAEQVWYEKDLDNLRLVIHGGKGEVSYRLTAPRFDWMTLPTLLPNEGISGLIVNTDQDGKVLLGE